MEDNKNANGTGYLRLLDNHEVIINDEDLIELQGQLWTLLGKQAERYTMGDSSSLPIETAEELLSSITYTVRSYLRAKGSPAAIREELRSRPLEELFREGQQAVLDEFSLSGRLFKKVQDTALAIDNISYNDTIASIATFFKRYDYRFMAQAIPCDIDYQLAIPLPELYGVEYINEYLTRLIIENKFCSYFERDSIISLLRGYCLDYKELLINIFDPVFVNAVGLKLLNKDIKELNISSMDREMLVNLFSSLDSSVINDKVAGAAVLILKEMKLSDNYSLQYLIKAAEELSSRIVNLKGQGLQGVFISFKEEEYEAIEFIDGELMEDEELRRLIDELQQCRYLSDKLAMVKRQIHSLGDLIEVLNECFFGHELIEVFKLFSSEEMELLLSYAHEEEGYANGFKYKWTDRLEEYIVEGR